VKGEGSEKGAKKGAAGKPSNKKLLSALGLRNGMRGPGKEQNSEGRREGQSQRRGRGTERPLWTKDPSEAEPGVGDSSDGAKTEFLRVAGITAAGVAETEKRVLAALRTSHNVARKEGGRGGIARRHNVDQFRLIMKWRKNTGSRGEIVLGEGTVSARVEHVTARKILGKCPVPSPSKGAKEDLWLYGPKLLRRRR